LGDCHDGTVGYDHISLYQCIHRQTVLIRLPAKSSPTRDETAYSNARHSAPDDIDTGAYFKSR
jgi:hypothetical protein